MVSVSSAGLKSEYIVEGLMDINDRCQKLPLIKTHRNPWGGGLQEDDEIKDVVQGFIKTIH